MPVSKVMYALLSTGMKVRPWALSGCWDHDCCWINFLCSLVRPWWSSLLFEYFWLLHQIFFFVRSYFYICRGLLLLRSLPSLMPPYQIKKIHIFRSCRSESGALLMMKFNSCEVSSSQEAVWMCEYLLIWSVVLRHSAVPIKLFPSIASSGSWERESVCKLSYI